ncbi:MAG: hypothetical protein ACRD88_07625 [Terriglobia bacterium]
MALLWRQCALVLLFVFVWDIGFELLAPLHLDAEAQLAPVQIAGAAETEPHPDCGLPDHQCAVSHHHHFPALISATQSIILPVATEPLAGTLPVAAYHRPSAASLIRGPPSSFNPLFS